MNNFIIGSIVLCKLMISEPQNTMTTIAGSTSTSKGATGNQILDQFNVNDKKVIESKTKEIEQDGDSIAIVGQVDEIRSVTKYAKNAATGKYKKTQYQMLVVKSEKIDKLFIDPRACGLADDLMEKEQTPEEKKLAEEKAIAAPAITKPKTKTKSSTTKKLNNSKVGEYIIVPKDTVLGDEFEVVNDAKLEKEIMEAISKNDQTKIPVDPTKPAAVAPKTLEEDLYDSQSAAFTKAAPETTKEVVEVKIETKEERKELVPVEDMEMFDFLATEKAAEKAKEVKQEVKEVKIAKPEVKKETKKIEKQKVTDEISSEEKSVLSEALDIAF